MWCYDDRNLTCSPTLETEKADGDEVGRGVVLSTRRQLVQVASTIVGGGSHATFWRGAYNHLFFTSDFGHPLMGKPYMDFQEVGFHSSKIISLISNRNPTLLRSMSLIGCFAPPESGSSRGGNTPTYSRLHD